MLVRRFNFLNWPIRAKLGLIFVLAVALPSTLLLFPLSSYFRTQRTLANESVRLETVGLYGAAQVDQTFNKLAAQLDQFVAAPAEYQQFEQFVTLDPRASQTQPELVQNITDQVTRIMTDAPSLSRVRLYNAHAVLLMDATNNGETIAIDASGATSGATPADTLITSGALKHHITISTIYPGGDTAPSVDVIFSLLPSANSTEGDPAAGSIVFTQNLTRASEDPLLPDLFGALGRVPKGNISTHIFLLDENGSLLTPTSKRPLQFDASRSKGVQAALADSIGTSTYDSPVLQASVLAYHTRLVTDYGPAFVLLAETPMSDIRRQVAQDQVMVIIALGLNVLILAVTVIVSSNFVIARPLSRLSDLARRIMAGHMDEPPARQARRDEIGVLHNAFSDLTRQLFSTIDTLEQRVSQRTRSLETIQEIGRVLTSIRDLDTLLEEVVTLIRDQFEPVYHAQVFLVDSRTNRANLRASTGAVGRLLLERGHFLDVGSQSVIGSVTATGHAVIALDVSKNPIHRRNEFLPDTRAEMAIPLRIGNRITGALDLQSMSPDAFSQEDVELFQGMADQIAVAIENAILFEESHTRLAQIERLNRTLTASAWSETERQHDLTPLVAAAGITSANETWSDLQLAAMQARHIADRVDGADVTFAVPVILRDQVLGAIEWQIPLARYTADTRAIATELSARLALAAENLRLYDQSRRTAQRELLVNQISSKLIGTTDIDQILQTAVRELGLALRASHTTVQLHDQSALSVENPGE